MRIMCERVGIYRRKFSTSSTPAVESANKECQCSVVVNIAYPAPVPVLVYYRDPPQDQLLVSEWARNALNGGVAGPRQDARNYYHGRSHGRFLAAATVLDVTEVQ